MTLRKRKQAPRLMSHPPMRPPVAGFGCNLGDPSTFDTIRFYDYSYDPGQQGIGHRHWDFGDGGSAAGRAPEHRFAADGEYTVMLTASTPDGRSTSSSSSLRVRTHDVSISRFEAPSVCRAGEALDVVVGVASTRYDETVEVQLLRSKPGELVSFEQVDRVTAVVSAAGTACPTCVKLRVTFSDDDAAVGTANLKAVVSILGARDASPDDNTALASIRIAS